MFEDILEEGLNIYATTASSASESSWATYCSPSDMINGTEVGSCLGDEYSVNWMEDSDADSGLRKSLQQQFENTKAVTKGSAVHQYGNMSYKTKDIGQYQGNHSESAKLMKLAGKVVSLFKNLYEEFYGIARSTIHSVSINSRDVKLEYLKRKSILLGTEEAKSAYAEELEHMQKVDEIFVNFNKNLNLSFGDSYETINFECLKTNVETYKSVCTWGEYDLKYVRNIAVACAKNTTQTVSEVIKSICS